MVSYVVDCCSSPGDYGCLLLVSVVCCCVLRIDVAFWLFVPGPRCSRLFVVVCCNCSLCVGVVLLRIGVVCRLLLRGVVR